MVAAWGLGGPLFSAGLALALAGKETFLMNLDQQNLATFKDLSRQKLPKTSLFPPISLLFFISPFPCSHTQGRGQSAGLSPGLGCVLQADTGGRPLPTGMTWEEGPSWPMYEKRKGKEKAKRPKEKIKTQNETKTLPHATIFHTPNARLGRTPVPVARNNS